MNEPEMPPRAIIRERMAELKERIQTATSDNEVLHSDADELLVLMLSTYGEHDFVRDYEEAQGFFWYA